MSMGTVSSQICIRCERGTGVDPPNPGLVECQLNQTKNANYESWYKDSNMIVVQQVDCVDIPSTLSFMEP